MAIRDLHCVRDGTTVTVIWSWDKDEGTARITVTRLLDGVEVVSRSVGQALYQSALNSSRHGPSVEVPVVPVRVEVRDDEDAQSVELLEGRYLVEWQLVTRSVYGPKRLFRKQELLGREVILRLWSPCREEVPGDLFYYVVNAPGWSGGKGYLPSLRPGPNEYGVILRPGAGITLCCDSNREGLSRLFSLRRKPDLEE